MSKCSRGTFFVTVLIITAVVFLSPQFSYCQKSAAAPQWIKESWREANYPQSKYYSGFSQDILKRDANVSQVTQRVEKEAQNKMAQGISVHISATSQTKTTSNQVRQGEKVNETIGKDYEQIIQASTNAQVAKTETFSYHDKESNKVYAFAAVKRSDLASYYASIIETALNEAQAGLELAKQLAEAGNNKGAAEKIAQNKKKIESINYYRDLLLAVDTENGVKRAQGERVNELIKKLTAAQIEVQNVMFVYLCSKEIILGEETDIVLSGLQTVLTENNCRIADSEEKAGFILNIEAKAADPKSDGAFHYCSAAVKVSLINTKTANPEAVINVKGPKEGGMTAQAAAEAAFKSVVPLIWVKIKDKIVVN